MEPSTKKRKLAPKVSAVSDNKLPPPLPPPLPPAPQLHEPVPPPFPVSEAALVERHDFESFARHLQDAAMLIQKQTERPRYTDVSVLMLRWEDDESADHDLLALENVLRTTYNYRTQTWHIPTCPNPSVKLGVKIASFLENPRPDQLLIVYYSGHGYVGSDGQLYWASKGSEDEAKLKWDGVRRLFEDAQSDILLLLDTCAGPDPTPSGSRGAKQAIAACPAGNDRRSVNGWSFTLSLIHAFRKLSGLRSFSTQMLLEEVTSQQLVVSGGRHNDTMHFQRPVFFNITPGKSKYLTLSPASRRSPAGPGVTPNSIGMGRQDVSAGEDVVLDPEAIAVIKFEEARILVCTTFVGDASPDMSFFHNWLQNTPSLATKIAVEGMFLGPPTMLLISMPHSIWNVVQHDKVCCFLGYITSHNMLHLYQDLLGPSGPKPPTRETEEARMLHEAKDRGSMPQPTSAAPPAPPGPPAPGPPATSPTYEGQDRGAREAAHLASAAAAARDVAARDAAARDTTARVTAARDTVGRDAVSRDAAPPVDRPSLPPPNGPPRNTLPPISPGANTSSTPKRKEENEGSEEMREAAEQLKALSHVRHRSDEGPQASSGRPRTSLPNGILQTDNLNSRNDGGTSEPSSPEKLRSPTSRVKVPRHPLPKNETRCNHCSHAPFRDSSSLRKHIAAAHTRPFPCAFHFAGCNSTFGSKNEWKRHIASQHLCLQYYRCSACPPSPIEGKGNEFNRKDLFTQHLRRMHAPFQIKRPASKGDSKMQAEWEHQVKSLQESCLVNRRKPPQKAACPKPECSNVFEGRVAWDEWTEHVGRHMEKGEAANLNVDSCLIDWALEEGIIEPKTGGGYRLCYNSANQGSGGSGETSSLSEGKDQQDGPNSALPEDSPPQESPIKDTMRISETLNKEPSAEANRPKEVASPKSAINVTTTPDTTVKMDIDE